jgi:hypothetical protein
MLKRLCATLCYFVLLKIFFKNNPFLFCQTKTLLYICTNELLIIKKQGYESKS